MNKDITQARNKYLIMLIVITSLISLSLLIYKLRIWIKNGIDVVIDFSHHHYFLTAFFLIATTLIILKIKTKKQTK
ncbi:MAG: hypothetical protein AB7O73_11250 [Bacteroidia bacterium]